MIMIKIIKLLTIMGFVSVMTTGLAEGFPPANVHVVEAKISQLTPTSWVSGQVVSPNNSKIASEVSGRVIRLAELGQHVKQGEIIAQIDDSRLQINRKELRASVQSHQARYKFQASEVKRIQALAKRNLSAKTELDKIISERDIAKSDLAEAQSRLARVEQDITFSNLKAPFDGLVTHRLSNLGEYVESGKGIIQFVETSHIEASVAAPITVYPFIKEGQKLSVQSPMGELLLPIKALVPVAANRSHLMEIRMDLSGVDWPIGLKVKVAVPNATSKRVLAIPRDALILRRDGISIYIIDSNNQAQQLSVQVGIGAGEQVEAIGALKVGDKVVVRGAERLSPGQAVVIKAHNDNLISGKN